MPSETASASTPAAAVKELSHAAKVQLVLTSTTQYNHPATVLLHASDLIAKHTGRLSDADKHGVLEAGIVAALGCGRNAVAREWLSKLVARFGESSQRVRRLRALVFEAEGQMDQARAEYQALHKANPVDPFPVRRMAAQLKGAGRYKEAIALLESKPVFSDRATQRDFTYRELHPTDEAAMRELLNLHWCLGHLDRCVYYAEEVLMVDPHNFVSFSRLGEVLYAADNLQGAIGAYSQSVRLNDHRSNVRALYGLWQCAAEVLRRNNKKTGGAAGASGASAAGSGAGAAGARGAAALLPGATADLSDPVGTALQLMQVAEARLRACYAGSTTLSALELTLQRYGSKTM
jgi:tetratricopeptide (TPR) repeat protein